MNRIQLVWPISGIDTKVVVTLHIIAHKETIHLQISFETTVVGICTSSAINFINRRYYNTSPHRYRMLWSWPIAVLNSLANFHLAQFMSLTPPQTRHMFDAHKPNENCSLLYFLPARHYLIVALLLFKEKKILQFWCDHDLSNKTTDWFLGFYDKWSISECIISILMTLFFPQPESLYSAVYYS